MSPQSDLVLEHRGDNDVNLQPLVKSAQWIKLRWNRISTTQAQALWTQFYGSPDAFLFMFICRCIDIHCTWIIRLDASADQQRRVAKFWSEHLGWIDYQTLIRHRHLDNPVAVDRLFGDFLDYWKTLNISLSQRRNLYRHMLQRLNHLPDLLI